MTFYVQIANLVAAARELTRGLGFRSDFVSLGRGLLSTPLNQFPTIDEYGDLRRTLQKPFIFDSLLYSGTQSIGQLAQNLSSFKSHANMGSKDYLAYLKSLSLTKNVSKELFKVMTSKTLESRGARGAVLSMKTSPRYKLISDLADNYWDTEDFLMTSKPVRGITLRAKLQSLGMYSLYGAGTLELLEAIGYATVLNPQMLEFDKVSRFY